MICPCTFDPRNPTMQGTDLHDPSRRGNYDPEVRVTGSGAPLILVPGMDGTGRLFYAQVPLLAQRYRVATYALRDDAPSMSTLVDDLAGQIQAMTPGGEPAVVVGESFGGALAMTLAVTRPECVRALVVINSFARFLPQFRLHLAMLGVAGAVSAQPPSGPIGGPLTGPVVPGVPFTEV